MTDGAAVAAAAIEKAAGAGLIATERGVGDGQCAVVVDAAAVAAGAASDVETEERMICMAASASLIAVYRAVGDGQRANAVDTAAAAAVHVAAFGYAADASRIVSERAVNDCQRGAVVDATAVAAGI